MKISACDPRLYPPLSPLYRQRTNGGRLDHVADGKSLYRLVLGSTSAAVRAADGLDVATTLLVAPVGCSLFDLVRISMRF